jgi:hypothetical protein
VLHQPPPDNVNALQQVLIEGGRKAFDLVPKLLSRVIEERQWSRHRDRNGEPFASFEAFAQHPYWQGLEATIDDLLAYCRKHPKVARLIKREVDPLATMAEAGAQGGRGNKASSITTSFDRGATYTLKRLKRDHQGLFDRVVSGELSANAAAIEAGFRKTPTALEQLRKVWSKASDDDRRTFKAEIAE